MKRDNLEGRAERAWVLYDVGNSAFVLVMVTAIMPLFFKEYGAEGMAPAAATAKWGYANGTASLLLALLAPVLGAMADYRRKKGFFLFFLAFGLIFTCALVFVQAGQWLLCLVLFVAARVGWAGANIFYDAFLTDVTSPAGMDSLSARGYGWGYVGSVVPFLLIIALLFTAGLGDGLPVGAVKCGFLIVAAWWLALSLPLIRHVHQKHGREPTSTPIKDALGELLSTMGRVRKNRQVFLFLAAYFFYIDGVGTIISMSIAYGHDLGFGVTLLIGVLLFIQIVAFPFALLFGRLAAIFSTKSMLLLGIGVYCLVTCLAFALPWIPDVGTRTILFWCIAFLVASSMGGIQALSRSYYARIIPPESSAEYFGFYNVFGKFAAITGPFLMGILGHLTGDTRWGVLSILFLFLAGGVLLWKVQGPQTE